jgi:hypothetical protein
MSADWVRYISTSFCVFPSIKKPVVIAEIPDEWRGDRNRVLVNFTNCVSNRLQYLKAERTLLCSLVLSLTTWQFWCINLRMGLWKKCYRCHKRVSKPLFQWSWNLSHVNLHRRKTRNLNSSHYSKSPNLDHHGCYSHSTLSHRALNNIT